MNSKISVIIPVYNTEKYFERCIKSVLESSYHNLEIIVVNDGSPGNIDKIIKDYQHKDNRIVYLSHEKNQGLFRARVSGMKAATGDYVAFIDSDDYISYDFYRCLLTKAESNNSDMVIGKTVWEDCGERYVYNYHESCFNFDLLEGDSIKNAYYSQEAASYSWHTVWNKLYSARLIKKCLPVFEKMQKHIIMTEDICFSSVFFYEAERLSTVHEEAYFYCMNADASTNTEKISINRFVKNISDIADVFGLVENYLEDKNADEDLKKHFYNAKLHYARMWQHLLNTSIDAKDKPKAQEAIDKLAKDFSMKNMENEYFFESVKTPWKGALEYIKEGIGSSDNEFVSFDIFDTLILRPFYEPTDILELCDEKFRKLTGSNISFAKIRKNAESILRSNHWKTHPGDEDITLSEIYDCIEKTYNISPDIVKAMQEEETGLEIKFAKRRNTGCSLFEFAKSLKKKVLLVTDMYLERDTIEAILNKNNITGYERLYISCEERRLKYNGGLFNCVLRDYPEAKNNLVHIGDTWNSDIEGSKKAGFESIFLPKGKEIFENKISGYVTNQCASLGHGVAGQILDANKTIENIGIKSMMALVTNKYFDNPYRLFNEQSNLNADPFFIGYYTVGMHLLGMCKWIDEEVKAKNCKTIRFLSRDGYLPMKAYEIYKKYSGNDVEISYLQTSRKSLLPVMINSKLSFYQLPVEYRAHTAKTLLKLISFASKDLSEIEIKALLHKDGINYTKPIADEEEYTTLIGSYLNNIYSEEKHEAAKEKVRAYFKRVNKSDIAFDMGYSGRIQAAISDACGFPVDVLFLHEDYKSSNKMKAYSGFKVSSFYDFRPSVSGLFREHLLSDCKGSCIGYEIKGEEAVAVHEEELKLYSDKFVVETIQNAALAFVKDYLESFKGHYEELDFSPIEASLPFEGFIRQPTCMDLHIFSASFFEDEVWGAKADINIEEFLRNQTNSLNENSPCFNESGKIYQNDTFMELMNKKSKLTRALLWTLAEPKKLKEKTIINIKRVLKK